MQNISSKYIIQKGKTWFLCPYCGKKLVKLLDDTECNNLPIWCNRCKRELVLKINRKTNIYAYATMVKAL